MHFKTFRCKTQKTWMSLSWNFAYPLMYNKNKLKWLFRLYEQELLKLHMCFVQAECCRYFSSFIVADKIKACTHSLVISSEKLSLPRHNSANAYLWDQWSVDYLRLGQTVMITTGNKKQQHWFIISLLKFVWIW